MKDVVKLMSVSEWLPIEFDENEPFISYKGERIDIRELVRFEKGKMARTVDFTEYGNEDRFPRFIEVAANGKEIRLWKLMDVDDTNAYLAMPLREIITKADVVECLEAAGVVKVKDLLNTSRETLEAATNGNEDLLSKILHVQGMVENVMED